MTTSKATDAGRSLTIEAPAGGDKLVLTAMHGTEALGRLYEFELDMISEGSQVDYTDLLGKNVSIKLDRYENDPRYFNGIISRFILTSVEEDLHGNKIYHYRATMVPYIWLLTRYANCRMFQGKTVPEIVESVLKDRGYTDVKKHFMKSYRTWEYCVQYRETDFNFISRLLENEGIYYYFEHEKGKHTLVLCDSPTAHKAAPNYSELHFYHATRDEKHDDYIWDWVLGHEITPLKYVIRDFNFKKPLTLLERENSVSDHPGNPAKLEVYDYPGGFEESPEGKAYVETRAQEVSTPYAIGHGSSCARGIFAGCTFKLVDHPACNTGDDEYLITAVSYQLHGDEVVAGTGKGVSGEIYRCQLICMRKPFKYQPPRITPKPVVQGPQTAIVAGPSGEEIYLDKYGRVKVSFHWDRESNKDEKSSCWIRVAQNWAGKQWGIIFHPRIGQEVIVEFLEGDPDRPIITGRVYNADQMPPYTLPEKQTQSTIKTRSSKSGTPENFNEIRFEDKKGDEQLFIHAEKNQDIEVEKDETHWVGHDRTKTIDNDETTHVKHDRTETVDNNEAITIHGTRTETVDKDETITIHATRTKTVDKDESVTVGGKLTEVIDKEVQITMNDKQTITVAKDKSESIDGALSTSVGKDNSLSVGKKLVIDAGDEINITTGDASISMKKDGTIVIKGKDITIEGSGKINAKASGDMVLKGSKIAAN